MAKKSKNKKNQNNKNNQKTTGMTVEKQNEIISQTNELINNLKNTKSNIFNRKTKELALKQADDLQNLLNANEYYVLEEKLRSLKEIEEKEKAELRKEEELAKQKAPKKTFKDRMQAIKEFDRWPLYSRTKRILEQEEGKMKIQKLCIMYGLFIIFLAVSIVGLLMLIQVIPFDMGTENTANNYIPALVFAIPLACIFFV